MRLLLACFLTLLCACAASPYKQAGITGGYQDRMLSPELWLVSYYGNGYTNEETVQTYWLHHAAELTLSHGFDGFAIMDEVHLTQLAPDGATPIVAAVDSGLDGKPYLVARILMQHAPLIQRTGRVFDARALKAFLDPYVLGEKCGTNVCPHVHRYLLPDFNASAPPA